MVAGERVVVRVVVDPERHPETHLVAEVVDRLRHLLGRRELVVEGEVAVVGAPAVVDLDGVTRHSCFLEPARVLEHLLLRDARVELGPAVPERCLVLRRRRVALVRTAGDAGVVLVDRVRCAFHEDGVRGAVAVLDLEAGRARLPAAQRHGHHVTGVEPDPGGGLGEPERVDHEVRGRPEDVVLDRGLVQRPRLLGVGPAVLGLRLAMAVPVAGRRHVVVHPGAENGVRSCPGQVQLVAICGRGESHVRGVGGLGGLDGQVEDAVPPPRVAHLRRARPAGRRTDLECSGAGRLGGQHALLSAPGRDADRVAVDLDRVARCTRPAADVERDHPAGLRGSAPSALRQRCWPRR